MKSDRRETQREFGTFETRIKSMEVQQTGLVVRLSGQANGIVFKSRLLRNRRPSVYRGRSISFIIAKSLHSMQTALLEYMPAQQLKNRKKLLKGTEW